MRKDTVLRKFIADFPNKLWTLIKQIVVEDLTQTAPSKGSMAAGGTWKRTITDTDKAVKQWHPRLRAYI